MKSPFRDERELSIHLIEHVDRLERENAALRTELEQAKRDRPDLPLVSFGFVVTAAAAVIGLVGGLIAMSVWVMGHPF